MRVPINYSVVIISFPLHIVLLNIKYIIVFKDNGTYNTPEYGMILRRERWRISQHCPIKTIIEIKLWEMLIREYSTKICPINMVKDSQIT